MYMKFSKKISWMLAMLMIASMSFMSCTKEGPAGLPGKDGKDGKDGENGINGLDGTATCAVCHDNSQVNFAVTRHWEKSQHAMGNTYLRNSASCAGCHTSQGFREIILTGEDNTAATIANPNPPNCYTCHNVHGEYNINDWALATTAPVTLRITGDAIDLGKGNLCANCHQPRQPGPMPEVDGADVTITNFRFGPHYGAQAVIASGKGGFEIGTGYTNSAHVNMVENSCVTCHLVENAGENAGGHMMNLSYGDPENPSVLTTACTACHTNPETLETLMTNVKTELADLLAELNAKLKEKGIMNEANYAVEGTWPANYAGALINHNLVKYDHSNGVHNYPYAKKLLENSIAALD
jgi:nitrate/TMAO reductase-like tetraheme cytochrome c subunit